MSTEVICEKCGRTIERYEDSGPYVEVADGLCRSCEGADRKFDVAFAEYEARDV
jgi:NMD protein affecting ribosome stability and mRNA decay